MRSGSQRIPRNPSRVLRVQRHLEDYDALLIDDRDVTPNEGVRWFVARQFAGYCHSIPARGLHAIDLVISAIPANLAALSISVQKKPRRNQRG
jgi:hypothetical protein